MTAAVPGAMFALLSSRSIVAAARTSMWRTAVGSKPTIDALKRARRSSSGDTRRVDECSRRLLAMTVACVRREHCVGDLFDSEIRGVDTRIGRRRIRVGARAREAVERRDSVT